MYLEVPKSMKALVDQSRQVAKHVLRPISRKYDLAEHAYPKELDTLAALMDGMNDAGASQGAGAKMQARADSASDGSVRNGANMATCLGVVELCWGDVGLTLSVPRQGLGNSAIAAVANEEQKERSRAFGRRWQSPNQAPVLTRPIFEPQRGWTATNGC